jgi:hypothetical protein
VNPFTFRGYFSAAGAGQSTPQSEAESPACGDVIGEISGVVAYPGQERGVHLGPMMSVWTCSTGIAMNLAEVFAARGRSRR